MCIRDRFSTDVYVYDPDNNQWETRQPLPEARSAASAVAAGNKIFLVGGTNGEKLLTDLLVYFPTREENGEDPWEVRTSLPAGRSNAGAALIAHGLSLVGAGDHRSPGLRGERVQHRFQRRPGACAQQSGQRGQMALRDPGLNQIKGGAVESDHDDPTGAACSC